MPAACKYCGGSTVLCAELAEPSLIVLTSDIDYPPPTVYDGWIPVAPKALKTGRNRYLSGQGKELRDGKNLDEMHWFIKNLARAAFVSGTTERAYNLFEKAMKSGQYRWGRTAKLVAGACISIALRQSNRPDMFPDLALLLDQKVTSLTRAFSSVISVLKIQPCDLPSSEPKSHISILQSHLSAALQGSADAQLPPSLIAAVKTPPHLLASSIPPTPVAHLPVSATACAAEARTTLAQLGDLAAFLGTKCNVKKPLVMSRYKVIQDDLIQRIDKIDWLDHYDPHNGKSGRAKIPRRLVRECRRQTLHQPHKTAGHPEGGESDSDADPQPSRPRKRRRVHALRDATRFLLNPLSGALPASFLSTSPSALPLPTYLLTSALSMRNHQLPSRLGLLSVARGGLFDDGELEKIMRTDEHEIAELRSIMGWPEGVEEDPPQSKEPRPRKRAKNDTKPTTSSRLNAAAVACFLADEKSDEKDEFGSLLRLDDDVVIIGEDKEDNEALIGLQRNLVGEFAEEEEDDEDPFDDGSPEPDDRYAQEI
ncbi:hypothetical protein B0H14DRAFT_2659939 [Mycena olivaceomarginata]|nr:hypothetical protein B0H14DRAFT_2659939 [Mycena olivaceomarginata]